MRGDQPVVLYVVRENPQSGVDEFVAATPHEVEPGAVAAIRELGESGGTRYVHALLRRPVLEWEGRWTTLTVGHEGPFAAALVRDRVVAYVTRECDCTTELLTIAVKELPEAGLEVPAGRLDHGETLQEGLLRELAEETGLTGGVRVVRELPDFECTYRTFSHNHAFHLVAVGETPDRWEHRVVGTGVDAGMTHVCRWLPLADDLELWNGRDPMLAKLQV